MNIRTDPGKTTGHAILAHNRETIGVIVEALGTSGHETLRDQPAMRQDSPLRLARTRLTALTFSRILRGGRLDDLGRGPRYLLLAGLLICAIWVPIAAYLTFAPLRYASKVSLILPGAGVSTSVNLSDIGQATSSANSAYSSSTISPTVTYQSLLQSGSVAQRAAEKMGLSIPALGQPRVKLLDQTSLFQMEMTGASPEQARDKAAAVLAAFLVELDKLRNDEIDRRETSTTGTVQLYQKSVDSIRKEISALQMESGLTSEEQYGSIVAANEALKSRVTEIDAELKQHSSSVDSLSGMLKVSPDLAAAAMKLHADLEFSALAAAASQQSAALAESSRQYGPKHPKVVTIWKKQLGAKLKMLERGRKITGLPVEVIQDEIDLSSQGERSALLSRLVTLVVERDGLSAQLQSLKNELEVGRARVRDLVGTASRLDSLNRDYKVAEAVFASALARINTSKTDIFASYPMVQVAEPPTLEFSPSSPKKLIAIAAGIAATLFLLIGLGLAWVRRPLIDKILARPQPSEPRSDA